MDISSATAPIALYSNVQQTAGSVVASSQVEREESRSDASPEAKGDTVTISSVGSASSLEAQQALDEKTAKEALEESKPESLKTDEESEKSAKTGGEEDTQLRNGKELTQEEVTVLDRMVTRDREVRAHEQAHAAVGGQYAGAPTYDYQRGPDGRLYAAGGEVSIDTGAISGDPQATIDKMQVVMQAASAPAEPSGQDRRVQAQAAAILSEAMAELAQVKEQEKVEEQAKVDEARAAKEAEEAEKEKESKRSESDSSSESRLPESTQPDLVRSLAELTEAQIGFDRQLVDTGAFSKAFPEGILVNNVA